MHLWRVMRTKLVYLTVGKEAQVRTKYTVMKLCNLYIIYNVGRLNLNGKNRYQVKNVYVWIIYIGKCMNDIIVILFQNIKCNSTVKATK